MVVYTDLVKDFAKRTRSNLDLLRNLQKEHPDQPIFEVTQLYLGGLFCVYLPFF